MRATPAYHFIFRAVGVIVFAAPAPVIAETPPSSIRFVESTKSSGIDFNMTCGQTPSREIIEVDGGGVAMFDYDNDGDLDLFFANGATMADPEHGPGSRLYANNGDGTFTNVTDRTGIKVQRWAMGVAVGDYDGDGFDDLYITCYGPNILLHSEPHGAGGRRFRDVTAKAGVGDARWGTSAAFGDIDNDGDLDLYVVNYLDFDVRNPPDRARKNYRGMPVMAGPAGLTPQTDVLYENRGNGTFVDITQNSGCTPKEPGYGLGVVILDFDGDGRQDIFVGNDSTANFLFRNQGGRKFLSAGLVSGISANYEGFTQATMGIAIGDVDGNGYADLFTTNFASDTNTLHLNLGDGFFEDRTSQYGLAMISRPYLSWGTGFYDFDSDGDEDLYIASGHVYPDAKKHKLDAGYEQPPLLFERGERRFRLNKEAGGMFKSRFAGRATAFGDIDDDGDVDVVMTTLNGPVRIFRNDSPHRSVVVVELRGPRGNPRGLGSMIELIADGGGSEAVVTRQRRWIHGGSYQSSDAPRAYFGLGNLPPDTKLTVRVTWPDGKTTEHPGVSPNHRVVIPHSGGGLQSTAINRRSDETQP